MADPVPPAVPTPSEGYAPYLEDRRRTDANHLRALSIFHYLLAAFNAVMLACFVYGMVMMARITSRGEAEMAGHGQPSLMHPWWNFGQATLVFGGFYGVVMGLNAVSGWCIARHRAWKFSVAVAGLDLLCFPLGTVLGIFTLIVLLRGSVSTLYAEPPR